MVPQSAWHYETMLTSREPPRIRLEVDAREMMEAKIIEHAATRIKNLRQAFQAQKANRTASRMDHRIFGNDTHDAVAFAPESGFPPVRPNY